MAFRAQIQAQNRGLSWIGSQHEVRLPITSGRVPLSAFPSSFSRPSTSLSLPLSPPPPRLRFAVQDRHRSQPAPQWLHRYRDRYNDRHNDCYGPYQHCPQRRYQRQRVVDPRLSKPLISAVSASHPIRIAQAQSQAATPSSCRSNKLRFPLAPRVGFVFSNPATPHLRLPRLCFSSSSTTTTTTMPVGTVLVTGYDPSLPSLVSRLPLHLVSSFVARLLPDLLRCCARCVSMIFATRRDTMRKRCDAMQCDAMQSSPYGLVN